MGGLWQAAQTEYVLSVTPCKSCNRYDMLTDAIMCSRSTSVFSPPTGIQQAFPTQICSNWTHVAGAGGFKTAPTSLLLTLVCWLHFRHLADFVSPSRLGIDSCQTAHKKMLVRVDTKHQHSMFFKFCFFLISGFRNKILSTFFWKHWLLRLLNKAYYNTLTGRLKCWIKFSKSIRDIKLIHRLKKRDYI